MNLIKIRTSFLGLKNHKFTLLFTLFYFIFVLFFNINLNSFLNTQKYYSNDTSSYENYALNSNSIYTFTITPSNNHWNGISIHYHLIDPHEHHFLSIKISDEHGNVQYSNMIKDNNVFVSEVDQELFWKTYFATAINAKPNVSYLVTLQAENVLLEINTNNDSPVYKLYGNFLGVFYYLLLNVLYWFIFISIFLLFCYFILYKDISVIKLSIILTSVLGLIYLFIMPPLTIPDENVHYDTAYILSNKILGIDSAPGMITKRITDTVITPDNYSLDKNRWIKSYYFDILKQLPEAFNNRDTTLVSVKPYDFIVNTVFFLYIPQSIGITLGRILHLSGLSTFYLARLFNLLFCLLTVFLSIRKLKETKVAFIVILLLPMTLHQIASCSYDVVIIALCFAFIAKISYYLETKEIISKKSLIFLFLLAFLITPLKYAYFPILFIFFALPVSCFKSKKAKYLSNVLLIVCVILSLLVTNFIKIDKLYSYESTTFVDSFTLVNTNAFSFSWIIHNLFSFLSIFINTIANWLYYWFITLIGSQLGWLSIYISLPIIYCFVLSYFSTSHSQFTFNKSLTIKLTFLVSFLLCSSCIIGGAYFWKIGGPGVIDGIQGRYFLPILPVILFLLPHPVEKEAKKVLFYFSCLSILVYTNILFSIIGIVN